MDQHTRKMREERKALFKELDILKKAEGSKRRNPNQSKSRRKPSKLELIAVFGIIMIGVVYFMKKRNKDG